MTTPNARQRTQDTPKTAHTPGPWAICDEQIWSSEINDYVCCIRRFGELTAQDEANARLIAAAPDLLAACKDAREALFNQKQDGLDRHEFAYAVLDTAIQKAESEVEK